MTGMPAWGATHDDDAIWPVVAFMTKLPELDETQYQGLLANAQGIGHHSNGSADEGHSHDNESSENTDHDDDRTDSHKHDESEQQPDAPPAQEDHDHDSHEH